MLLTTKEIADTFGVHPSTIRRAYRAGRIPYERFCKMYFFDLDKVREAMQLNGLTARDLAGGLRAAAGESRRSTQPTSPRLGKTGASIAQAPRRKE